MTNIRGNKDPFLRGSLSHARQQIQRRPPATQTPQPSEAQQPHPPTAPPINNSPLPRKKLNRSKLIVIAAIAAAVALVLSGYFLWQNHKSDADDGAVISQRIVNKVDKIYILPEGENPTVAEIKDRDQLNNQPFFSDAVNGDYLLVYEQAGIALIYRESEDKLVAASPVGQTQQPSASSEAATSTPVSGQDTNQPSPQNTPQE